MKATKAVRSFVKFFTAALIMFGKNVVAKMTGNPHFLNPDVPLDDLTDAINKLINADSAAAGRDKRQCALRRQARKELTDLLKVQAAYVNRISKGNIIKILSSGYHISKATGPKSYKVFWVKQGTYPGEIIAGCKSIPGAGAYLWQYCISDVFPDSYPWIQAGATRQRSISIKDLGVNKTVWVRFCGVVWKGMLPWSDPIKIRLR
jgi:hypothetical protein